MKKLLNCPNCGAPVTSEKCEYCGAVFLDFAAIQVGAPSYVKFTVGGSHILSRLMITSFEITQSADTVEYITDTGVLFREETSRGFDFHIDAHAVAGQDGNLVKIIQEG